MKAPDGKYAAGGGVAGAIGQESNAIWENWYNKYSLTWAPYEGLFPGDFVAVVEAYKYSGADDVEYGIIWASDNKNFYHFKVTPDGWYIASCEAQR